MTEEIMLKLDSRQCNSQKLLLFMSILIITSFIIMLNLRHHRYSFTVNSIGATNQDKEMRESFTVSKVNSHSDMNSIIRCKYQSMGCFTLDLSEKKIYKSEQKSSKSCLHDCSERTYRYYGMIESTCYCGNSTKQLVDIGSWRFCGESLKGNKLMEVFHIKESCHTGYPDALIQKYYIGCVPLLPQIFMLDKQKVFRTSAISTKQCIFLCEERKFPLAMISSQRSTCLCFEPRTIFRNATELQELLNLCKAKNKNNNKEKYFHLYHTYIEDRFCSSRAFLEPNESPVTALASPPGSGNTWMRYLLEVSTGIYSGSSYGDRRLLKGGFIGESLHYESGRTLVVKDHFMKEMNRNYKRGVILLRNPFHALLADYHRKYFGHVGIATNETLTPEVFKEYISTAAPEWFRRIQRYFTHIGRDKIVVLYEDLIENLQHQMRRVINFFPKKLIEKYIPNLEDRLVCLVLDHTGSFKRPKTEFPYYLFGDEVKYTVRKALDKLNNLLAQNNLKKPPESYSDP